MEIVMQYILTAKHRKKFHTDLDNYHKYLGTSFFVPKSGLEGRPEGQVGVVALFDGEFVENRLPEGFGAGECGGVIVHYSDNCFGEGLGFGYI
jgi:hypothetical protein